MLGQKVTNVFYMSKNQNFTRIMDLLHSICYDANEAVSANTAKDVSYSILQVRLTGVQGPV